MSFLTTQLERAKQLIQQRILPILKQLDQQSQMNLYIALGSSFFILSLCYTIGWLVLRRLIGPSTLLNVSMAILFLGIVYPLYWLLQQTKSSHTKETPSQTPPTSVDQADSTEQANHRPIPSPQTPSHQKQEVLLTTGTNDQIETREDSSPLTSHPKTEQEPNHALPTPTPQPKATTVAPTPQPKATTPQVVISAETKTDISESEPAPLPEKPDEYVEEPLPIDIPEIKLPIIELTQLFQPQQHNTTLNIAQAETRQEYDDVLQTFEQFSMTKQMDVDWDISRASVMVFTHRFDDARRLLSSIQTQHPNTRYEKDAKILLLIAQILQPT